MLMQQLYSFFFFAHFVVFNWFCLQIETEMETKTIRKDSVTNQEKTNFNDKNNNYSDQIAKLQEELKEIRTESLDMNGTYIFIFCLAKKHNHIFVLVTRTHTIKKKYRHKFSL